MLKSITNFLQDDSKHELRSFCVCGTGGVGKTQTVLKYAHDNSKAYQTIFWVHADTREKIDQDIDSFVRKGYAEGVTEGPQQVREAFMTWLSYHSQWLLVLDNVDDVKLLKDYLPRSQTGAVLITSRNPSILRIAGNGLEILPFTEEEGADFILGQTSAEPGTLKAAKKASKLLGGLPIALCHLIGYLDITVLTLEEFLSIPEVSALSFHLLDSHEDEVTAFDYELSFRTVFDQSLRTLLEPDRTVALELLQILVLFDSDSVSEPWLKKALPVVRPETPLPLWLRQPESFNGQKEFNHAIELLRQRSLAFKDRNTRTLGVHPMVGWACRRTWDKPTWQRAFGRAKAILIAVFPKQIKGRTMTNGDNLAKCRNAANHVFALEIRYREARGADIELPAGLDFAELLAHCGYYFYERGQLDNASNMLQSAREICHSEVGEEPNLITALVLNNIAVMHSQLNQIPQALELNQRVATMREAILGSEAEDLGNIFNNIATNYYDLDRCEEAETYFLKALTIFKKKVPVDEYGLSTLLTNTGRNYTRLNRFDKAEQFLLDALEMQMRCIGERHYFTSATLYRLCQLRMRQGNLPDAEKYIDQCLESRKQAVGPQDFRYAVAEHKKATLRCRQHSPKEGIVLLDSAISKFELNTGRCEGGLLVRSMLLKANILEMSKCQGEAHDVRQNALQLKDKLESRLKNLDCSTVDSLDLLVQSDFR